ncbi:MAG: BCCT family transporter [Bdellovibrionota bacterium]|nr:BCCT family transporter [Bdellovibrionota bacterium]
MSLQNNINKNVFFSSAIFIFLITITGAFFPESLSNFFNMVQSWLIQKVSWIYILSVGSILFFCIFLMMSRLGDIKLGPDHSEPDYSYTSWFAMLFSAGMGIGLLFFGVAEPMMHFSAPPIGEANSIESAKEAMKISFFHWGLHAWGIYALLAVILAYFSYRKNLPLLPRSALYPFIGEKIHGRIGDVIDTFAVIGTMFGVATSLGFGVAQVNAGLNYLFELPQSSVVQVILIAIITAFATVSVVLGLDGGIKKLSQINVILAVFLMGAILLLGSTVDIMQAYVQNTGAYLSDIIYKTFNMYAYDKKDSWIGGWTLLYWGWWVSWSPFVGMFIARISKGRSIREFMVGVLFVPTGFTFLWMTVFGNSAIKFALEDKAKDLLIAVNSNVPVALFKFLEHFPFSSALSLLAVLLVITFFVSSSDSGSLVIDTLTSGGAEEPPVWQRIFWAVTEGVVAAVLLLAGGLEALQTMTIASAFPMIIMIGIGTIGLLKALKEDHLLLSSVQNHTTSVQYTQANASWKERLSAIIKYPSQNSAEVFLKEIVFPALQDVKNELINNGVHAELVDKENFVRLLISKGDVNDDFIYEISLRNFETPEYADQNQKEFFRAEVFLKSGGQDYDVFGYTKEQIVADAVTQYEKHSHFLHLQSQNSIR